ncbi:MAG: type I restriction enzyme HsdR N-terminal domain-containing protein [Pyrinomonadaceae bacterium MAG19_C2-C3]|nr:type I restriction enzyme HsdR N-terminal domain-containing protein [Pyrinomonadaceae bacterium MAG19_C2-C3]
MNPIEEGTRRNLISFNAERTRIKYPQQNKSYNFNDPEERVRAEAFVRLVVDYNYPVKRISLETVVPMGVAKKSADIIVYEDDARTAPYIIVECKKADATDAEYKLGIDEGFSYANALKASYLWVTSKTLDSYFDTKNFGGQEREENRLADIPRLGKKPPKAKYFRGGVDETGEKAFDIETISQSEMTRKFKQAHDALWAGGKRNPSEAFDELDKLIFCKIWDEKRDRKRGTPYDFQVFTGEPPEDSLRRVQKIYEEGRKEDPEVFKDDIRLSPPELETVVGYLAPLNLNETDLDSKGRAFESFMGSFFRGEFGQYFTPRPVVDFIVDVLPIRNKDLVLDPACGSSGFLLHALNKIRKQADD